MRLMLSVYDITSFKQQEEEEEEERALCARSCIPL